MSENWWLTEPDHEEPEPDERDWGLDEETGEWD